MTHACTLTVRGYECDSYGHVNNAVYLNYLEYARTEFMKAGGLDYRRLRSSGYGFVVSKITIAYLRPAVFDDELRIVTSPLSRKTTHGTFRQRIQRGDEEIADAEVTWVTVDRNGRPTRLPPELDSPHFAPGEGATSA
ncbi:MAG TPA: thioesterase family protein [Spirochaetia bacterium]|nr:thioesterase family protein [Spirochaetia bacterium]